MLGHGKGAVGRSSLISTAGATIRRFHHENEIAQSCCANDTDAMANYRMHNEMLQVEAKDVQKLGQLSTVRSAGSRRAVGEVIRFVMLPTHTASRLTDGEEAEEAVEDAGDAGGMPYADLTKLP
jgi:cysteinyl-tRNA synthetase